MPTAAIRLADKIERLRRDVGSQYSNVIVPHTDIEKLEQDHRSFNGVKRQADANNFPNADEVLAKEAQDIEDREAAIEAAEAELKEVLL